MPIDIGGIYVGGLWDNGIKANFSTLFKDNLTLELSGAPPRDDDAIKERIKAGARKIAKISKNSTLTFSYLDLGHFLG